MSQKKLTEILDINILDIEELTDEQLELIAGGGVIIHDVNSTTAINFNPPEMATLRGVLGDPGP